MADSPPDFSNGLREVNRAKLIDDIARLSQSGGSAHDLRTSQLRRICDIFQRRHRRLSRARELELSLGTELQYQWQICADYRRHYDESTEKFMHQAMLVVGKTGRKTLATKLGKTHVQVQADQMMLTAQSVRTKELEILRSEQSSKIKKLESVLDKAVSSLSAFLNDEFDTVHTEYDDDGSVSSIEPPSSMSNVENPLLEDYYDKTGNIAIMRERLSEVYSEYVDERAQRIFRADQDQILENTDEQFDASYQVAIQNAQESIENAIDARQEALEKCRAAGVEIPPPKPVSESSAVVSGVSGMPLTGTWSGVTRSPPRSQAPKTELVSPAPPTIATGHMLPDGTAGPDAKVGSYIEDSSIEKWIREIPDLMPSGVGIHRNATDATAPVIMSLDDDLGAASEGRWRGNSLTAESIDLETAELAKVGSDDFSAMNTTPPVPTQAISDPSARRQSATDRHSWSEHRQPEDRGCRDDGDVCDSPDAHVCNTDQVDLVISQAPPPDLPDLS
ncbi:hypothetical protein B0A48_17654 [Cryoendolithus antarcticus]|uniref:Uncharacterized protein n=1 Tax=Cryoendolithus antarcticus TaxID=1507870 RepID=A0A1V8SB99_9PEZI|nr:hypothetical protein B0A48_17654 [Cryoendolithus antarcticus]